MEWYILSWILLFVMVFYFWKDNKKKATYYTEAEKDEFNKKRLLNRKNRMDLFLGSILVVIILGVLFAISSYKPLQIIVVSLIIIWGYFYLRK